MTGSLVARRYARAIFDLGKKGQLPELEKIGERLRTLRVAFEATPKLARLFRAPVFSVAEKVKVLEKLLNKLDIDAPVGNFCRLLAEKERLGELPAISTLYDTYLDGEKGIIRGELTTAVQLGDEKRQSVRERLAKQAGRPLELSFSVDPKILGGVVLKVGDKVMDASLRAQLSILKDNIKKGEQGHAD